MTNKRVADRVDINGLVSVVKENKEHQKPLINLSKTGACVQLENDFLCGNDSLFISLPLSNQKELNCSIGPLFMDPDPEQIRLAAQVGADRIELYTESYAQAYKHNRQLDEVFQRFVLAAQVAAEEGLGLNAGHDLDLHNLPRFAAIPGLLEVSIGHALTVDAIHLGLANAVAAYQDALGNR